MPLSNMERASGLIAKTLAPRDTQAQAEIICAYLEDLCPKRYRHKIVIEPKSALSGRRNSRSYRINETLELLASAAAEDDSFLEHLLSLRNLASATLSRKEATPS
jgi:hypothetical protein